MNFILNFQNKEVEFIKEAFINVSKYSSGEIIITDEKFNILFQNSKYVTENGTFNFLDLSENFITNNFKKTIKNFKLSDKNHMFVKMIFDII